MLGDVEPATSRLANWRQHQEAFTKLPVQLARTDKDMSDID